MPTTSALLYFWPTSWEVGISLFFLQVLLLKKYESYNLGEIKLLLSLVKEVKKNIDGRQMKDE